MSSPRPRDTDWMVWGMTWTLRFVKARQVILTSMGISALCLRPLMAMNVLLKIWLLRHFNILQRLAHDFGMSIYPHFTIPGILSNIPTCIVPVGAWPDSLDLFYFSAPIPWLLYAFASTSSHLCLSLEVCPRSGEATVATSTESRTSLGVHFSWEA